MSGQVKAEYDFEAQPNSGEMSITAGEILTVIRRNVEGGWMEGSNSRGQVGLFPESYVTPHYGPPPSAPPVRIVLIVFFFLVTQGNSMWKRWLLINMHSFLSKWIFLTQF
ncbi:SH3 domain protein [Oesophagostomum dentatum]|uniref:SH3 domain protein n=1 Tax=Oesophagostomum dentatum TaxID=61180 RepID=A0A0B1T8A9_OESDE|nr:SH3 domain protein [Oesophagostomum dentatum]